MRGLEVGWGVGAAEGARRDVVEDGRVAGVVEAFAADAAGWGGGEDLVAGFAVVAVAGDARLAMVGAAGVRAGSTADDAGAQPHHARETRS